MAKLFDRALHRSEAFGRDALCGCRRVTSSRLGPGQVARMCRPDQLAGQVRPVDGLCEEERNADTMLFMVGVDTPASRCSIWNRRRHLPSPYQVSAPGTLQSAPRQECSCAASPREPAHVHVVD